MRSVVPPDVRTEAMILDRISRVTLSIAVELAARVRLQILGFYGVCRDELIVPLLRDFNFIPPHGKLEQAITASTMNWAETGRHVSVGNFSRQQAMSCAV